MLEAERKGASWHIFVELLDDEGYALGERTESTCTAPELVDVLTNAWSGGISLIEVGGLSAEEAASLLQPFLMTHLDLPGEWQINGEHCELLDGELLPLRRAIPGFSANFRERAHEYGLSDDELTGWTEFELDGLLEAAEYQDLDAGVLGVWMQEHPGDPDAVFENWARDESGRD